MKRLASKQQPVVSPSKSASGEKMTQAEFEAWADQASIELTNSLNRYVRSRYVRDGELIGLHVSLNHNFPRSRSTET